MVAEVRLILAIEVRYILPPWVCSEGLPPSGIRLRICQIDVPGCRKGISLGAVRGRGSRTRVRGILL